MASSCALSSGRVRGEDDAVVPRGQADEARFVGLGDESLQHGRRVDEMLDAVVDAVGSRPALQDRGAGGDQIFPGERGARPLNGSHKGWGEPLGNLELHPTS